MFRKATEKDIDAIERIYNDIHTAEENGLTTTGWKRDIYPVREDAEKAVRRGDMFVCEANGEIVSSAMINRIQVDVYAGCNWKYPASDNKVMVIHTLSVSPSLFGQGIGSSFLHFYEEYAAEKGCTVLRLDTNAKNLTARKLYKDLGFIESGIVSCTFNSLSGVDLVLLEKEITQNTKKS